MEAIIEQGTHRLGERIPSSRSMRGESYREARQTFRQSCLKVTYEGTSGIICEAFCLGY